MALDDCDNLGFLSDEDRRAMEKARSLLEQLWELHFQEEDIVSDLDSFRRKLGNVKPPNRNSAE